nr:MAG TPA: hypothetical protein [Caudoviricetes sp.]
MFCIIKYSHLYLPPIVIYFLKIIYRFVRFGFFSGLFNIYL